MPLFVMNVLQIIPNGEEIVPAVLAFAEELNEDPLKKQWIICWFFSIINL